VSEAEELYRKGTQLLDQNPGQAIVHLTKSLEINPDSPPALYNRAVAYARVGRDDEAISDLNRLEIIAAEIGKRLREELRLSAGGYTSIAEDEYKAKNYGAAITKCDSALAYNPEWGDAWVVKGLAYDKLGDGRKALECFNQGAKVDPSNYFIYINRAELHQKEKRLSDAVADYSKAIELEPTEPAPYSGRSSVYLALGNADKAAADDAKAKKLTKKHDGNN
jgi:tetratricopeptide (TPR) repeat protein